MTEIIVNDFIEKITNEDYEIKQVEANEADFKSKASELVTQLVANFLATVAADKLAQSRLLLQTTTEEPIIISLESGIVNLPFENIKQVDNFFMEPENSVDLMVNLIVKHPDLNASGLRIDSIGTVTELQENQADKEQQITNRVEELLQMLTDNLAAAEAEDEPEK
ncbi:hypothetical protein LPAF129_12510 [Ligilactobacillus pabuli]|uniref:Flagellar assembly protein FliH/Type III secretion system HrpE domain-containing protein n=1 Tax=Ligilactobacillus pabuli TaxID=2886039 RepID=A0ABQ5JKI0_9LACO|nr:hypothetical protein [Ligilactobacillus pabuli]GKS81565.1 hypothetical protein LPAF129_12510 [Ligilactobacillus pabuli]HIW88317.1 hypothetical protein [Candidatus Ligilactobacillus excrementipullorum]